jgi:BirA family biotin operon repressor/biotin-[acetyl-CoA-carboxylase] ligase
MLDIEQIKSSIEGNGFISSVYYLKELASTNTFASNKNIPVDSLVITDHQVSGKGRLNRTWESAKDLNLTFSIKKKLPLSPAENHFAVFYFSYYVYLTIYDELKKTLPENELKKLFIKWPNDILFDTLKLCGILIESKLPSNEYVIGIGINCNQEEFGSSVNAASMKNITGNQIDINKLLISLINRFSENFAQLLSAKFEEIFSNWKNSTNIIGKTCHFETGNDIINNGKIIDLKMDGSISIHTGETVTDFHTGDIHITGLS